MEGGRWGDTDTQRNIEGKLRQRGAEARAGGGGRNSVPELSPGCWRGSVGGKDPLET